MRSAHTNLALMCLALMLPMLGACSHIIRITHQDHSVKKIIVRVDEKNQEFLSYGDHTEFSVKEGVHRIEVGTPDYNRNIWSNDGAGWEIYLEDDCELTLMTPLRKQQEVPPTQREQELLKKLSPKGQNP